MYLWQIVGYSELEVQVWSTARIGVRGNINVDTIWRISVYTCALMPFAWQLSYEEVNLLVYQWQIFSEVQVRSTARIGGTNIVDTFIYIWRISVYVRQSLSHGNLNNSPGIDSEILQRWKEHCPIHNYSLNTKPMKRKSCQYCVFFLVEWADPGSPWGYCRPIVYYT